MQTDNFDADIINEFEKEILYQAIEDEVINKQKMNKEVLNNNSQNERKNRIIRRKKKIKKELKIRTILMLIIALLVNTYAWFIYVSIVITSVNIHVKSWDFEISVADQSQNFDFIVEQVYPGMPTAKKEIVAKNNGETEAVLTCEINKIRIFDEEYDTETEYEMPDGSRKKYTSEDLLQKLLNDYPFKVKVFFNDEQYTTNKEYPLIYGDITKITFQVDWDYETGNVSENGVADGDEEDTYYGMKSYEYMQNQEDGKYGIQVGLVVKAVQKPDEEEVP